MSLLTNIEDTLIILSFIVLSAHPTTILPLIMDDSFGNDVFPYLVLGPIMTSTKYELVAKFLKMKPS